MDLTAQVDAYCERTDFTFWSEPLNAVTNAAFLIGALIAWRLLRAEGRDDLATTLLTIILCAIGIGSFLFHTYATRWAGIADVVPILAFILVYLFFIVTRLFALPWWAGLLGAVLFIPYAGAVSAGVAAMVGPLNGSVGYIPVPIGLLIFAYLLRNRMPEVARGFVIGVAILSVSLVMRTVDEAVCARFPIGTHIFWHLLNGTMLAWMILVMGRAPRPAT